jgi:hypothetical protein
MSALVFGTRDFARTTLGPRHRRIARSLLEVFVAPDDDVPDERLDAVVCDLDRYVSPASKTLRFGLLVMLELIHFAPLFLLGRLTTFEELDFDARTRVIKRMERSRVTPITLVVVAYKTVMTMLYYEDDAELRKMGYSSERARYKMLEKRPE